MANIIEYLDWRGDLTIEERPFNEVDNLIIAELSYIHYEGVVPPPLLGDGTPIGDIYCMFGGACPQERLHGVGVVVEREISALLDKAANTQRFANVKLNAYTQRNDALREQQFAAVTAELGDGTVYIAFRGTDDTLIGWKEDLNLGYLPTIPSHEEAVSYVRRVAQQYPTEKLRIGGHSKGGNLAVYSAANCGEEIQKRILAVYNNDGPGFAERMDEQEGYRRIADRIQTFVPQDSVVGKLLEHEEDAQIVYSSESGVLQHDGFTWAVRGDHFVHLDAPSRQGKMIDETLERWLLEMDMSQREATVQALYDLLRSTGAKKLSDLNDEWLKNALRMLKTYKELDKDSRDALNDAIRRLLRLSAEEIFQDVQEHEIAPLLRKREATRGKLFGKKGKP